MENEISNKEEYAASLAANAEKALKILKTAVIVTAVCAVVLPLISIILLLTADKAVYGIVGLCISLGVFVIMLAVLAGVIFYVRKQLKALKSLDGNTADNSDKDK